MSHDFYIISKLRDEELIFVGFKINKSQYAPSISSYEFDEDSVVKLKFNREVINKKIFNLIMQLSSLKELTLINCNIDFIPDTLANLTQLKKLNLENNNIEEIPDNFINLKNLTKLNLENNPIFNHFFYELKDLEATKLIRYLLLIKNEGGKPLNEAKILVVGDERVGKTSIINRLVHNKFHENEISTEGITICSLNLNNSIKVNIWDFAGQEITHQTHQFFLSNRSLYLCVLDAQKEDNDSATHDWLESIKQSSKDSPIIIIINKHDLNKSYEFDVNRYKELFPNIVSVQYISAKENINLTSLTETINHNVNKLDNIKNILPKNWFNVKRELENMSLHHQNFIESATYEKICENNNILDEVSQLELLDILHEVGTIVKYQNIYLNTIQILNPEWVTNAVYKIIRSNFIHNKSVLTKEDFYNIFKHDDNYKERHYQWIINLLIQFELAFKIDINKVLIPIKLPPNQPKVINHFHYEYSGRIQLQLRYKYSGKLKKSHISHFIVKSHRYIKKDSKSIKYWRRGVILNRGSSEATIISNEDKKEIHVKVYSQGKDAREFMALIRDIFSELNHNLDVSEQIPLIKNGKVVGYEDYEYLKSLELSSKHKDVPLKVNSKQKYEIFNISSLLDGYEKSLTSSFDYEKLIEDITNIGLIQTKSRNSIFNETEDKINDRFRDALYYTGYSVSDQSRAGDSETGKSTGERDIIINNGKGLEEVIIEALILKNNDNNTIKKHYSKLINKYDTFGHEYSFLLIYSKNKNFAHLWEQYSNNTEFKNFLNITKKYTEKSNIRIGRSTHKEKIIIHIFINFNSV